MKLLVLKICLLSLLANLSCNDNNGKMIPERNKVVLEEELPKHLSSQHFEYYMSQGDSVDTVFQEKYFNWLINELAVNVNEKIILYKFKDKKQMLKLTGIAFKGYYIPGTNSINIVCSSDNHECVHALVSKYMGMPPAFFNEGIAVAHQASLINSQFVLLCGDFDFHLESKYYLKNGRIPELMRFLSNSTFLQTDELIRYPVAGSFTRYLIDTYGIKKLKDFIMICSCMNDLQEISDKFLFVYNRPIDKAWSEWEVFLRNYNNSRDLDKFYSDLLSHLKERNK